MKANEVVVIERSPSTTDVLQLVTKKSYRLRFSGSSCNCSAQPGTEEINSFTIARPTENCDHLVAFEVIVSEGSGKNTSSYRYNFIAPVEASEMEFSINLDRGWVPAADRLLQIVRYGHLEIQIGKDLFTTRALYTEAEKEDANLHGQVNGNLICRYAAGIITADEFRQQVASWKDKQGLLAQLEDLQLQLGTTRTDFQCSQMECQGLLADLSKVASMTDQLKRAGAKNAAIAALAEDLDTAEIQINAKWPNWFQAHKRMEEKVRLLNRFLDDIEAINCMTPKPGN
ncbi:MAG: hypothetical protein V1846_04495 [Candidatus Komeilibacteria bacterium]